MKSKPPIFTANSIKGWKSKKANSIPPISNYPTDKQLKQGFGDDVIKVNNSCGAGALRGWNGTQTTMIQPVAIRGQRILADGPIRTVVDAEVKGWQYQGKELNMINRYTLYAGHAGNTKAKN